MAAIDLPINDPTLYMLASPAIIAVNPSMTSGSMSQPDSSAVASPRPAQATDAAAPVSSNINNAASTPSSSAALASLGTASSPTDVLLTLPPPILRLLVVSAPFIDVLAHFVQLLTWTHPNRFAPFLLPIAWITITLGGHALIKYGLNGALLTILGLGWVAGRGGQRFNKATARTTPPTHAHDDSSVRTLAPATINQPAVQVLTPAALNRLLDQSSVISIHLQALRRAYTPVLEPFTWRSPGLSYAWLNLLLTSYPFYLILTYFVPTSHIVCFAGITVLLWEAPWFAVIRRTLWSSVLVRRTARLLLRLLQGELRFAKTEVAVGQPNIGILAGIRSIRAIRINVGSDIAASPMKRAPSKSSDVQLYSRAVAEAEAAEVQYLFTIFENQACQVTLLLMPPSLTFAYAAMVDWFGMDTSSSSERASKLVRSYPCCLFSAWIVCLTYRYHCEHVYDHKNLHLEVVRPRMADTRYRWYHDIALDHRSQSESTSCSTSYSYSRTGQGLEGFAWRLEEYAQFPQQKRRNLV